MSGLTRIAAISALALSMSAGFALADECVDTSTTASTNHPAATGSASGDTNAGSADANRIAKDGSRAPLEGAQTSSEQQASTDTSSGATTPNASTDSTQTAERPGAASDSQSTDTAAADTVQKDGNNMPLQSSESDKSGADIATSQQDVEAQQEGEQTMAAKADKDC